MSFLSELMNQKRKLKQTETVVTCADGQRFVEKQIDSDNVNRTVCAPSEYGFVVDTKPDDIPATIINHLYIGSQDCAADDILKKYSIKHVLSVGINVKTKNVNHKYVECLDLPETDIIPVLQECVPFINHAIELQENILVHCNAGVSRTSMVAIAFLIQHQTLTYDEAYKLVKSSRPAIYPNEGFKRQLKTLKPGQGNT